MYKRQKAILIRFAVVILLTAAAVAGMVNFRDWIIKSEAIKGMEIVGQAVLKHRQDAGSLPPESFIDLVLSEEGIVRIGKIVYRARWIDIDSTGDEILAYSEINLYSWLISNGYVVLRLDGRVKWMDKPAFEQLLRSQQTPMEIKLSGQ
ncbi:MAG: hypothetical protein E4H40_01635 [Candidatus Brocadiia bacterium]|nr:MAG: hypothetical protein E4H40_01635 [Candidatus Brocadiia bacterium]